MPKKTTKKVPQERKKREYNKSQLIRDALEALDVGGKKASAKEVGGYLVAEKPDIFSQAVEKSDWGTIVSAQRTALLKKAITARVAGGPDGVGAVQGGNGVNNGVRTDITIDDVIALKEFSSMLESGILVEQALEKAKRILSIDQNKLSAAVAKVEELFGNGSSTHG